MLVYATTAQYSALTGDTPPDNFSTLNRYAAGLVREATLCDRWVPLPSGLPVDDDLREALSDAACEQIASWDAAGIDPQKGAGGQEVRASSTSLDGAAFTYDVAASAEARAEQTRSLCDAALMHLRNAGLGSTVVAGR